MPLPTIETPKYEVKIPSTGKKVIYRPYLVKEEKILLIALESQDQGQIIRAMKDVVASCTFNKVDPEKLTFFDLEYIFLKLRAKSVGEISKLNLKCEKCEKYTAREINVDAIELDATKMPNNRIKLTDKVGVIMSWPKVNFLADISEKAEKDQQAAAYEIVLQCIESIFDDKKNYPASESTKEELTEFIESLNQNQFKKIQEFIESMPKLEHTEEFECKHCQTKNTVVLTGLQNFFS